MIKKKIIKKKKEKEKKKYFLYLFPVLTEENELISKSTLSSI